MNWFRRLRFKQKLLIVNLGSLTMALILMAAVVGNYQRYLLEKSLIEQAKTLASVVGERSTAAVAFNDTHAANNNLAALREEGAIISACIWDKNGDLFATYYAAPYPRDECELFSDVVDIQMEGDFLYIPRLIRLDEEVIGRLTIRLSTAEIGREFLLIVGVLGFVTLILVAMMFFVINYWQRLVTEPLEKLSEVAGRISEDQDYSVRAVKSTEDEVGIFTDAFNKMLDTIRDQNMALLASQQDLEETVENRTQELTEANKELEAFSYSVSHDLRAPVRAVLSFSQIMQDGIGETLDDESRDHLQRIIAGGHRMEELINDLLNLSRLSRQQLEKTKTNLSEIAKDIVADIREHDQTREATIDIADNIVCYCDPNLARIVLNNLLGNAWKYCSKKSHARIVFEQRQMGGKNTLCISDNGIGFDMQYVNKLFMPFSRLHGSGEFEGTGIGLATVARIVKRHHGDIWADSSPGQGAAFFFTFGSEGDVY